MAIASIANGGSLLKPYIVAEVTDTDGKVIHRRKKGPLPVMFRHRRVHEGGDEESCQRRRRKMAFSPKVSIAGKQELPK